MILKDIGIKQDPKLFKVKKEVHEEKSMDFHINDTEGFSCLGSRLCVSNVSKMRKQLMLETHATPYALHPTM